MLTCGLPGRLGHPRDEAVVSQLAQADPAEAELAIDRARPAAAAAASVLAGLVLGRARLAHPLGRLGHWLLALLAGEGHAERVEEREGLLIGLGGRGDRDVEAAHLVDGVVVDLREDDLLAHAHRVVPAPVERRAPQAA